jgi:N,N'-diacetylchitobiose transport system permease protein
MSTARISARTARRTKTMGLNGIGLLVALVTLSPVFWMISTAFKPSQEIYSLIPSLVPAHPTLGNFSAVIGGQASGVMIFFLIVRRRMVGGLVAGAVKG